MAAALCLGAAEVPRPSNELLIHMPDGSQKPLSAYKGKPIVLMFFYTTCPHCQNTTQVLNTLVKEYAGRVQFLGVGFNDNVGKLLPEFNEKFKPAFPTGWSDRNTVYQYMQQSVMMPGYVPFMAFIDKKFTIRSQYNGDSEFFKDQRVNIKKQADALLHEGGIAAKGAPAKSAPAAKKTGKS